MFKETERATWEVPVVDKLLIGVTAVVVVLLFIPTSIQWLIGLFSLAIGIADGMWYSSGRKSILKALEDFDALQADLEYKNRFKQHISAVQANIRRGRKENMYRYLRVSSLWE